MILTVPTEVHKALMEKILTYLIAKTYFRNRRVSLEWDKVTVVVGAEPGWNVPMPRTAMKANIMNNLFVVKELLSFWYELSPGANFTTLRRRLRELRGFMQINADLEYVKKPKSTPTRKYKPRFTLEIDVAQARVRRVAAKFEADPVIAQHYEERVNAR